MPAWIDERREALARSYNRVQALIYLLRFGLLFALATVFWMSGLSRSLAAGLERGFSFPFAWPVVCAGFTAMAVFGYEVILFPLSVLADFSLERVYGHLDIEFGSWLRGYVMTMLIEVLIVTAGFTGIYVLMVFFPSVWWLAAMVAYAVVVVGLGEWGPSWLLPRVRPPVASDDVALEAELRRVGRLAGLDIQGAAWWDFDHQEDLEEIRLIGLGTRRRAVFSREAWRSLGLREQVFLAARHMAWLRHGRVLKVQAFQVALAGAVFLGAGWIADAAARSRGLSGVAAPEAFPFWVTALFGLAALAGLASHAVFRRVELAADRFALKHAGGKEVLLSCLEHEFERAPFAMDAPPWLVILLRRMPTPACRLAQADALAAAIPPAPADD